MTIPPQASHTPIPGVSRRHVLQLLGTAAAASAFAPLRARADDRGRKDDHEHPQHFRKRYVYVGTYTAPHTAPGGVQPSTAIGIYVFRMEEDGDLTSVQVVPAENPSFLALDPSLTHLYATVELGLPSDPTNGSFSAYAINGTNGNLSFLNTVPSDGAFPAHLSVHPSGQYLLGSNYGTGNFPIYALAADGSIGAMTDVFQDTGDGTGPNPDRQEGPHAHMILTGPDRTDPQGARIYGVDLGADKVMAWTFDLGTGQLTPNTVPWANVASGSGSRHMAFHPTANYAYVIDELASSITAFSYDPDRGAFIWIQTISTLPRKFQGTNTCAEIRVHPTGKWLYGTNRGHNTVAMYEIDQKTGRLDVIGWQSTFGEIPRGMNIDPSGTFLYAGNQNSDTIAVFQVHPETGRLLRGPLVNTPVPVDIEFGQVV
jgi:6-phosphogluconolactonase